MTSKKIYPFLYKKECDSLAYMGNELICFIWLPEFLIVENPGGWPIQSNEFFPKLLVSANTYLFIITY
jgi:hypothetical protein